MIKKNKKKNRRLILGLILLAILLLIIYTIFQKKDYTILYNISSYEIKETYKKEQNYYLLEIKKDDKTYITISPNTHFFGKKAINNIQEYQEDNEICIKLYSNKIKTYPLCHDNESQISYHLTTEKMKEHFQEYFETFPSLEEEYQNITIYNYLYHDFYIWNYQGFYHLNSSTKENINLFSKDIYDPKLLSSVNDFIFIPDYESNYYFEKAYLINRKTGKKEIWNLPSPIYFDSIILGSYENEIYLVDKHEKKEWKIDPKRKTMVRVDDGEMGKTYQNGFQEVSLTKLINQDYTFNGHNLNEYEIKDGLYKDNILIRRKSPDKIVKVLYDTVFYLDSDILYCYNDLLGEVKIMQLFEWNFNQNQMIHPF